MGEHDVILAKQSEQIAINANSIGKGMSIKDTVNPSSQTDQQNATSNNKNGEEKENT